MENTEVRPTQPEEQPLPQYIYDLAKVAHLDITGLTREEIFAVLDLIDTQWLDEIQNSDEWVANHKSK